MAQSCIQQLWYNKEKPLNNYFNRKLGQARPKVLTGASTVVSTQKVLKEFN